jgi:hypothetical protein
MHKRLPLLLALALAAPAIAGDTIYTKSLESVLTLRVDGDIEIDATGHVTSHTLKTELPPDMQALVDKAVARWKFLPPTENGKPIDRARSKMRIALVANEVEQKDGTTGLIVKIDNVTFPPAPVDPATAKNAPPEPAIDAGRLPKLQVAAEALIMFNVQYDATGRILNVAPAQCTVLALGRGTNAASACAELERQSVSAMKTWKVENVKPGLEKPETGAVGIKFMWSRANYRARENATGQWRRELRSPYRSAPWDAPDAPRVGTSDVDSGGALISRTAGLTLLEGIGKTL